MTEDPDHRRTMQASGTAPFVGHAADRPRAERARSLEAPDRHGPLKTGRFTVEIDGVQVSGFRVVDLPARSTRMQSQDGTDGDRQRTAWGRTEYDDLEMERGMRAGDATLSDWRTAVDQGRMEEASKRVVVTLQDENGAAVLEWRFTNARPLAYEPPTLDATTSDGGVATETVTVDFETVERIADSGPVKQQAGRGDSAVYRYVRAANGGRVDNGAVLTRAGDVGIERVTLDWLDASATAAGQHVGLLVPEGARSGGDAGALWLLRGSDLDEGGTRTIGQGAAGRLYWVPGAAFFHDPAWRSGGGESGGGSDSSSGLSVPGWQTSDRSSVRVLVDTGTRSLDDVFGLQAGSSAAESAGVRPAAAGETVDPAATVFAVAGPATAPYDTPSLQVTGSGPGQVADLLDAGGPAPLAGATFGLATFSTPDASIAGQSANPLVGMETTALLEHEVAREVLGQAGITDVETVEWLDGPRSVGADASTSVQMLGTGTTVESYEGVVSGQDGPWAVAVHVARITDDSHVIAAGAHRQPLGTAAGRSGAAGWQRAVTRGRRFTAETASRLEYL